MSIVTALELLDGRVNVSRETIERLSIYGDELRKWNPKINLVAPNTLADMWKRHFVDSLQLAALAPAGATHWLDLGSGGGFPGLVLAAHFKDSGPRVSLVESDGRKCAFLRNVARKTDLDVVIIDERIEEIEPQNADVISARALAPLDKLLCWSVRHGHSGTNYVLPKGRNWQNELTAAQENWHMEIENFPSLTDQEAQIMRLQDIKNND